MKKIILILLALLVLLLTKFAPEEKEFCTDIRYKDGSFKINELINKKGIVTLLADFTSEENPYGVSVEYDNTSNSIAVEGTVKSLNSVTKKLARPSSYKFTLFGSAINNEWTQHVVINKNALEFSNGTGTIIISKYSDTPLFMPNTIKCNAAVTYGSDGNYLLLADDVTFNLFGSEADIKDFFRETDVQYLFPDKTDNSEVPTINIPEINGNIDEEEDLIYYVFDGSYINYEEEMEYAEFAFYEKHPEFKGQPMESLPWFPKTDVNYGPVLVSRHKDGMTQKIDYGKNYDGFIIPYREDGFGENGRIPYDYASYELIIPSVDYIAPVFYGSAFEIQKTAIDYGPYVNNENFDYETFERYKQIAMSIGGHGSPKNISDFSTRLGMESHYDVEIGDYAYLFDSSEKLTVYKASDIEEYVVRPVSGHSEYEFFTYPDYVSTKDMVDELSENGTFKIIVTRCCNQDENLPDDVREFAEYQVFWKEVK